MFDFRTPLGPEEVGRRLRRARIEAGLSQAHVAEALGIPRSAVSLIESGKRSVSGIELARLSRLFAKPASTFLLEPDERKGDVLRYFRATAPLEEWDEAFLEEAITSFQYYALLERAAYGEQRYDVPEYPVPRGRAVDQGAYLADQERRRLGLGMAPLPSMIDLLEDQGVKVAVRMFPEDSPVSGCYLFSDELGPCVLINARDIASRRRFTCAHEYAHFLVDREERGDLCTTNRRRELPEMRANAFGAAFLLPAEGIEAFFQDLDVRPGRVEAEHAVHLVHHFGASYEAVLWRSVNLGWIDQGQREVLLAAGPSKLGALLGYVDREPSEAEPRPGRFRTVAIEAWRARAISVGELSELLGIAPGELRESLSRAGRYERKVVRSRADEPDWF